MEIGISEVIGNKTQPHCVFSLLLSTHAVNKMKKRDDWLLSKLGNYQLRPDVQKHMASTLKVYRVDPEPVTLSPRVAFNGKRHGEFWTKYEEILGLALEARGHRVLASPKLPTLDFIPDLIVDGWTICELDGRHHLKQLKYDRKRTAILSKQGYVLLRFSNNRVWNDLDGCIAEVENAVNGTRRLRCSKSGIDVNPHIP
jgi:hypothetical protein